MAGWASRRSATRSPRTCGREDRAGVIERSESAMQKLQEYIEDEQQHHEAPFDAVMKKAYDDVSNAFDYHEGGFSGAPKATGDAEPAGRLKNTSNSRRTSEANWSVAMGRPRSPAWRTAASATTSAAAFTATPWTAPARPPLREDAL